MSVPDDKSQRFSQDERRRDRVESERAFHDARFNEETREAQGKFYASIKRGNWRFDQRVAKLAEGARVLEYGCGVATQGMQLSPKADTVTGIDISQVAVDKAANEARRRALDNTDYRVMDAEQLTFPDRSFDLVFGRGIIHHLDLARCFATIARVLRPGGTALFWEPLGHNPLINFYRDRTPHARTEDEHPLTRSDFALASTHFEVRNSRFYGLTTLATVPLRDSRVGDALLGLTMKIDDALFKTPLRWLAWHVMLELRKPAGPD